MRKLKKEAINPIEECKDESTGGEVGDDQLDAFTKFLWDCF